MRRLPVVAVLLGFVIGVVPRADAQDATPFAHLSYTEGRVVVEHESTAEEVDGNTPLLAGDRVRTGDGRAEVLFGDGSLVQLDQQTTVDVLSDTVVRVMNGRIIVRASSARAGQLRIDTPAGSVFVDAAGEYHLGLMDTDGRPTLDLAVVRGRADLASDVERLTVEAGQRAWARTGEAPSYPVAFNSAELDAFEQWAADRLDARRGTVSYQYVAAPLRPYAGVLDEYGSWGYQAPYGYVWYPRVAVGWRPYYHGRWRFYASIGWTWIGGGIWAWPTHHYGRWGFAGARWFWIPGHSWGPGYVHWAIAPGYVSWCPLGFDNRPLFAFYHQGGHHGYSRYGYDGWRGWTVVPRRHFGAYASVNRVAVDGRTLFRQASPPAFVERAPAPRASTAFRRADGRSGSTTGLGVAVPRGATASDRSSVRRFSAGAVTARDRAISDARNQPASSRPDADAARARSRTGLASRDGGYITTDNGSRVYRVPSAVPRSLGPQPSNASSSLAAEAGAVNRRAPTRTALDDRRTNATPLTGDTSPAPFDGQRGNGDARGRRTALPPRNSYVAPGNDAAPRGRGPDASEHGGSVTGRQRTAPPAAGGAYAAPRGGSTPQSRAPYGGTERRATPSYRGNGAATRSMPGMIAPPSRDMPNRVRPAYERAVPQALPRGGAIRNDNGIGSTGGARVRPQSSPRMSAPSVPHGGRPSSSYGSRQDSGAGGRVRQAPSGAGRSNGSGHAVARGGRHR
jgi:hypothetical protein